jgi:photosystem II stability/assembly factor-like uncharacterized protein
MRSRDRGDSWERISDDLTGGGGALVDLVESPLDARRLVAGAGDVRISATKDGGATWSSIGEGLPRGRLRTIAASPHGAGRLHVCLAGRRSGDHRPLVFRSDDFGATWRSIAGGLPMAPVEVLLEDPRRDGILYVGSDLGVYASTDGGATWSSLSRGLPTAPVVDLAVDAGTATLVAVTHGLGAFALDVSKVVED